MLVGGGITYWIQRSVAIRAEKADQRLATKQRQLAARVITDELNHVDLLIYGEGPLDLKGRGVSLEAAWTQHREHLADLDLEVWEQIVSAVEWAWACETFSGDPKKDTRDSIHQDIYTATRALRPYLSDPPPPRYGNVEGMSGVHERLIEAAREAEKPKQDGPS